MQSRQALLTFVRTTWFSDSVVAPFSFEDFLLVRERFFADQLEIFLDSFDKYYDKSWHSELWGKSRRYSFRFFVYPRRSRRCKREKHEQHPSRNSRWPDFSVWATTVWFDNVFFNLVMTTTKVSKAVPCFDEESFNLPRTTKQSSNTTRSVSILIR